LHEAVSYAPRERLLDMAERCLENAAAELSRGPETALMMARIEDPVDGEVFNLGEILVTRCEMILDGENGWGMVLGDDPERALCAAVLDAAYWRGMPEETQDELMFQLASVREGRSERWAEVQPTRVEFEVTPP
jgi:alpha-D-ribose 1-methylphosphonate 5-triphosphate synthase subunit PhnG